MKTCLILGGHGFLGANLARALLAQGCRVRLFDRPGVRSPLAPCPSGRVEFFEGDFANASEVTHALESVDVVFHLVSTTLPMSSNENPIYDMETNVVPSLQLLEGMLHYGVGRIIFSSSGGTIYGPPRSVPIAESHPTEPLCAYGIGKLAIEKYLALNHHLHGLSHRILRIANPYGEGQHPGRPQGAVTVFAQKALADETIDIWGDGSVVRDYVYVGDVARAFVAAMDYDGQERTFNIGSGAGVSLLEIIAALEAILGRPVRRRHLEGRPFDVAVNVLDSSLALRKLGWRSETPLDEGMRRTLDWLRSSAATAGFARPQ